MVGTTKGKSKALAAKSKPKAPSMVSATPESVVSEGPSEGPLDGEEKKMEVPSTDEKEGDDEKIELPSTVTDEKGNTDAPSGLLVGNGLEVNQLADEGNEYQKRNVEKKGVENNDDENDIVDELNADEVDSLSGQTEETEDVSDGDDAVNNVESKNNGVDTEESTEELSDGGGAVNNMDNEHNEGKPDEEVAVEAEEPITDCGGDTNFHSGEENKDMEVAEDGKIVTGENLAASEHGVIDEEVMNKGTSGNLNAEEPLFTSANNEKTAEEMKKVSISNNVEASAEEVKKPRRKLIRNKVIKKVSNSVVASENEAKPQSSILNDASGNANSAETKEYERNEEKTELKQSVTINRKLKRKRKSRVSENYQLEESNAVGAASSDGQKAELTNNEQGTEVLKETGKLEVEDEKVKKLGNKASRLKNKGKQKVSNETTRNVVPGDTNKPGPSRKDKSKKIDTMGMIFMCNSETKKDCYRYKVLGLPAGKKDFVSKIDKGMTLFLFDVDLKMMYGIYKAAAPGGFDIEPRAFKSKFPSQVRFTILEDCVPLAEEKFKRAIKENYYTKNKFNCTLSSVQVGRLCALFRAATRRANSARIVRNPVEAAPSSLRDRKRKRTKEGRNALPISSSKRERRLSEREVRERRPSDRKVRERRHFDREVRERRHSEREVRERRHSEREVRERRHSDREVRPGPVVVDDRYYQHPVVYEREAYLPPPAPPVQVLYQALPPPSLPQPSSYSYGEPTRDDIYRREPVLEQGSVIERRDLGLSGLRLPADADLHEPYSSYKESPAAYRAPTYETGIRRDLQESSVRQDHYEPSARRDRYEPSARRDGYEPSARQDLYEPSARREHYDYTSDARQGEYYATEYRPPLPPHRRY